jgi:ABC-2 type transport system permease protein
MLLPGNGFSAANGYPPLSLANGSTARAAAGTVLYLVLIALLSLGIGTAVRDTAGAIITVLSLLYIFPIIAGFVTDPQWHERLEKFAPMTAGLSIQATTNLDRLAIGPWPGLGVLAGYATGAMLLGLLVFMRRDA